MIENVIFDLDGTLVDTSIDIIDCLNKAYDECHLSLNGKKIGRSNIGPPLYDMISTITPGLLHEDKNRVVRSFRSRYDKGDYVMTRVIEGVPAMLEKLLDRGVRMFVATHKPLIPVRKILNLLPRNFFMDVATPDIKAGMVLSKKEMIYYLIEKWNLPKDKTVSLGDSASDVIAAHNNGLMAVATLNGYGDSTEIEESEPEFTISETSDLYPLIMNMNRWEDRSEQRHF